MIEWNDLIRKGYLPEVLPPIFSSAQFANFVANRNKSLPETNPLISLVF